MGGIVNLSPSLKGKRPLKKQPIQMVNRLNQEGIILREEGKQLNREIRIPGGNIRNMTLK